MGKYRGVVYFVLFFEQCCFNLKWNIELLNLGVRACNNMLVRAAD